MRKLFVSSFFIFIILAGCSNDEAYNNAIQKGLDYIASEEFQKAESAFELALDEKKDDEKATALLEQTVNYQEALKAMEEGDLDIAKEKAEEIIKKEDGSSALIKKAEAVVTSIKDLETTLAEVTEDYEAALKHLEDKKYTEANKLVDNMLTNELEHPIFKTIKKDVKQLQKDIESALVAAETPEKEQTEPEKIEEEKTATDAKPTKYDLELNPNQEGFYSGVRYSGETGAAGPDEYHTIEDARAMGYEVIPITYDEYGMPIIEGLDKPYPYDRWLEDYSADFHVEGNVFDFGDGMVLEFSYTSINDATGEHRAVFFNPNGDEFAEWLDFGF